MSKEEEGFEADETGKSDSKMRLMQLRFRGKLLEMETAPEFPKPYEVIRITAISGAADFGLLERKVLNYLLAHAYQSGIEESDRQVHRVKVGQIANAVRHNDYDAIRAAVKTLQNIRVRYDKLDKGARLVVGEQHLLSTETAVDEIDPILSYEIPFGVRALMRKPSVYAYVALDTIFRFRSKFTVALYELLSLLVRRNHRLETYSVEDLVDFMGWPRNDKNGFAWKNFKASGLTVAINEINAADSVPFTVKEDYIPHPTDSRKTIQVRFRLTLKRAEAKRNDSKIKSPIDKVIPPTLLELAKQSVKTEVIDAWWKSFRLSRVGKEEPRDLATAWETWMDAKMENARKENKFHVPSNAVSTALSTYGAELGFSDDAYGPQKKKRAKSGKLHTVATLLQVWRLRCEDAERRVVDGTASADDYKLLTETSISEHMRVEAFKRVLKTEQEAGWPGIPTRDERAPLKIRAFRMMMSQRPKLEDIETMNGLPVVPADTPIMDETFIEALQKKVDENLAYLKSKGLHFRGDPYEDRGWVLARMVSDMKAKEAKGLLTVESQAASDEEPAQSFDDLDYDDMSEGEAVKIGLDEDFSEFALGIEPPCASVGDEDMDDLDIPY